MFTQRPRPLSILLLLLLLPACSQENSSTEAVAGSASADAAVPPPVLEQWEAAALADLRRSCARARDRFEGYIARLERLADRVQQDAELQDFFRLQLRYQQARSLAPPPPALQEHMQRLRSAVEGRYLRDYLAFYDILFIRNDGTVLHTLRREADHGAQLFAGELAGTELSRRLQADPDCRFVPYAPYAPSAESSAFFIRPVADAGTRIGWFAMQAGSDRINTMFAHDEHLGRTGEVLLVDEARQVLNRPRWRPDHHAEDLRLAAANIERKFARGQGSLQVTDYRGRPVLSAFDTLRVGDSRWLVIAKQDRAEILTRAWQAHGARLLPALRARLADSDHNREPQPMTPPSRDFLRVDMDEYHRISSGERIGTYGVSTCTAVLICLPGDFAYLAHCSVEDAVYGTSDGTDLIGRMLRDIKAFEIPQARLRELQALIVAPHLRSLPGCLERLIDGGLLLDQITLRHQPAADHAILAHSCRQPCHTEVQWVGSDMGPGPLALDRLLRDLLQQQAEGD